jgi:hypothetical protein
MGDHVTAAAEVLGITPEALTDLAKGITDYSINTVADLAAAVAKAEKATMSTAETFLSENPALGEMLECYNEHPEVHATNTFARDVIAKFHRFGKLSDKQLSALEQSLQRDHGRSAEASEPKGDAPVGRQTVTGEVLALKEKESKYGLTLKALFKLPNNSRVWVTAPKDRPVTKGDTLTFTSTFEVSKDDRSFAFGNKTVYEGGGYVVVDSVTSAAAAMERVTLDAYTASKTPTAKAKPAKAEKSALAELLEEMEL